jgi:Tfp pilus assembly protein PilF
MSYLSRRLGLTRFEADEYYAQALDAFQNGDLDAAIDKLGFALALLPQNSEYLAVRGLCYLEDGVAAEAKADFEWALKIHDGEVLANYGMGILAYQGKKWEEAIAWFNKARAVNPMQVEIPYYLALIYHRQQDNRTAKTYMEQAQQLMTNAGDKRRADAKRWIREFEKLIRQEKMPEPEPMMQTELPIQGAASGTSVSQDALGPGTTAGLPATTDNDPQAS